MKYTEIKVLDKICRMLGVIVDDVFETTRKREICEARQMFMYWLKENTTYSLSSIGKTVRTVPMDHTTVMHGINTIKNIIHTDNRLKEVWYSICDIQMVPFTSMKYRPTQNHLTTA